MNETSLLAALLIAGFLATYAWRLAAVILVRHLDVEGGVLLWVRAVATALVAALVMRLVVAPAGLMAASTLSVRLAALSLGIAAFWAFRRNVEAGVAVAIAALLAGQLLIV